MAMERQGFEFSLRTKAFVRRRSKGLCEAPGCENPGQMVAHLTGIKLGKLIGMNRGTLVSKDNAEHRCWPCEQAFTFQENRFIKAAIYRIERERRVG
jgi:hypothetical protein